MKVLVAIIFLLPIIDAYTMYYSNEKKESPPICRNKNGKWGNWGAWHDCSVTCGSGVQKRYRHCNNPRPMFDGLDCRGVSYQVRNCYSGFNCPIHGKWGSWGSSSACSKSCGGGIRQRKRDCNNPRPQNCGRPCSGDYKEDKSCNNGACPTVTWGSWSCNICTRNRERKTCEKKCTRTCSTGNYINCCTHAQNCHSSKVEICVGNEADDCHDIDVQGRCRSCHAKAVRTNNRGLYCRVDKSECNGLSGGIKKMYSGEGWYYLHCSNDGPWCKPCAVQTLVYNSKCGTCESTATGPCTDTGSWRKSHDMLNDEDMW